MTFSPTTRGTRPAAPEDWRSPARRKRRRRLHRLRSKGGVRGPASGLAFRCSLLFATALLAFGTLTATPAFADEDFSPGSKISFKSGLAIAVRGEQALRTERYDRAVRLLVRSLHSGLSQEDRARALANLCAAYLGTGEVGSALRTCDAAEEIGGATWQIHTNRGVALLMLDEFELARGEFTKALELNPNSRNATRGLAKAELGATTQAIAQAAR